MEQKEHELVFTILEFVGNGWWYFCSFSFMFFFWFFLEYFLLTQGSQTRVVMGSLFMTGLFSHQCLYDDQNLELLYY
jgi:hypothetical protein